MGLLNSVSYFFSVPFLLSQMDENGFVPLSVISRFNRVRALSQDVLIISEALKYSDVVEVRGQKVRPARNWSYWPMPPSPIGELVNVEGVHLIVGSLSVGDV